MVDLRKSQLVSKIIFKWISMKKPKRNGTMEFLQPVTTMNYVRTLLGHMKTMYDWNFSMDKDFNFPGGLKGKINELFEYQRKQAGVKFGTEQRVSKFNGVSSVKDLDFTKFNCDNLVEHQQALLAVFGAFAGLRGSEEHAYLMLSYLDREVFPVGHPRAGTEFYTLKNMPDKTNKLSTMNASLKRVEANQPKIPVDSVRGQIIDTYLKKISPDQLRFYCTPRS